MELELRRQTVPSFETILEETVEQPVECDALLPDYCPDIRRILKCTLTPVPVGKTITAGRLEVEGLATLNILYISAGGEPARGEYKVPFTRMLELHGEAEDPIITVGMLPGPVSCRAVNQRRLEIRGSVVVSAAMGSRSWPAARKKPSSCAWPSKRASASAAPLTGNSAWPKPPRWRAAPPP